MARLLLSEGVEVIAGSERLHVKEIKGRFAEAQNLNLVGNLFDRFHCDRDLCQRPLGKVCASGTTRTHG